jgi:hypothetical protein
VTTIRILDLETENHPWYGQLASPHNPDNYIVMVGWRDDIMGGTPGPVQHLHFTSKEDEQSCNWFNLDGVDMLVCHNAMYEISWFLSRYRAEFEKFCKRGGRVLCTQQAQYILSNFTDTYPSLDETAPLYGGTHKIDAVKELWKQGFRTSQIDPKLLLEYLTGPEGDVENTAHCLYGQMPLLVQRGQWRLFLERCEALLAFAYCEFAGLHVDMEVAERNLAEQEAELATLKVEAEKLLPELPEHFEFNWGSDYHMSALLFGGPIKYRTRVVRTNEFGEAMYEKQDCYKFGDKFYTPVENFSAEDAQACAQLHGNLDRYRAGKNKDQPKIHKVETTTKQTKWADTFFQFPGVIWIDQLPAHIQENFRFVEVGSRKNGEWTGARMLGDDKTPVYSTSSEVLDVLGKHGFEAAKLLVRMAQLDKDNGTYYRNIEYNADGSVKKVKGMLQYVQPDGIIHHNINMCATSTGRLSSSTPNLQNLPRDGTSQVKQMFTSRFGAAGKITEVDYSALEVVMLAALTGDQNLLEKLLDGTDMHCYRLAFKLKEDYNDVLAKAVHASGDPAHPNYHPDHKRYKQMRTDIKPPSFAAQYGASAQGIAYATGCTIEYAQEFLDNEARLFPASIAYRQVIRDEVERTGAFPEGLHREQRDDGGWSIYRRGYWQSPGGTRYSFRQYPKFDRATRQYIMDYKDTQIANYWCQGEAFYLMAVSAGRLIRWLISKDFFRTEEYPEGRAFLINNVHDALYFDCHESVYREVALAAKSIMEDAARYMSEQLGYNIAHVPFPAAAEAGPSMFDKEHIV